MTRLTRRDMLLAIAGIPLASLPSASVIEAIAAPGPISRDAIKQAAFEMPPGSAPITFVSRGMVSTIENFTSDDMGPDDIAEPTFRYDRTPGRSHLSCVELVKRGYGVTAYDLELAAVRAQHPWLAIDSDSPPRRRPPADDRPSPPVHELTDNSSRLAGGRGDGCQVSAGLALSSSVGRNGHKWRSSDFAFATECMTRPSHHTTAQSSKSRLQVAIPVIHRAPVRLLKNKLFTNASNRLGAVR